MKNKLQRKLKKRIIKVFGRGTYNGIIEGHLTINRFSKKGGVITKRTKSIMNKYYYMDNQYNPYLIFKNTY